ncbi:MAG TPA: methyl-accepting chemotaxis protein [Usitatibacter sp.]|nr:methyl-accepting chemotaxis protein [Usitatibacter sp.]
MTLRNLSIRTRLTALLMFVNTLLVVATGYAWYAIATMNTRIHDMDVTQNHVEEAGDLARQAQLHFKVQVQEWKNMLLRGHDLKLLDKHTKAFEEETAKVSSTLKALNAVAPKIELPATLADAAILEHEDLARRYTDAFKAFRSVEEGTSRDVDEAVRGIDRAATDHIDAIVKQVHEQGDLLAARSLKSAVDEKNALVAGLIALALIAIGVSAAAGALTIIGITRRLRTAADAARSVADGDLSQDIEAGRADELGRVLQSMREMNSSLAGIVGRVRDSAQKVSAAATQIAAGNTDLSSRTEEQASSLEETAASIEELTATVNQNANNAAQANDAAAFAANVARKGGDAVGDVVKTMDGIQKSSRRIADITGLIDSIAFQTNILALNAAVEAARAGDQGRGFAVVAGEVRSLAQRSAEAAREIKTLIGESVEQVNTGAQVARGAGETMQEIVANVTKVSQLIAEIASATTQQSSGIAQASQAVSELDKATQQNAALVEESTAASESLRRLAVDMAEAVSVFRLGDASTAAIAGPAKAAPLHRVPSPTVARIAKPLPGTKAKGSTTTTVEEWKEF